MISVVISRRIFLMTSPVMSLFNKYPEISLKYNIKDIFNDISKILYPIISPELSSIIFTIPPMYKASIAGRPCVIVVSQCARDIYNKSLQC